MTTTMKSGSNLEKVIASGQPAVTGELGPPMCADPAEVVHKAHMLKGFCDAANITDCQTAVVRISSIAAAVIAQREGLEPVMQMTCRDRNRIAMQADLLGAAALGLKNCLCIAGDHQSFSAAGKLKGHPGAKNVYDVDTTQLVGIMKKMRDEGLQQGGDKIAGRAEVLHRRLLDAHGRPDGLPAVQPQEEGRRRRRLHPDPGDLRRRALPLADEEGRRPRVLRAHGDARPGSSSRRAR